MKKLYSVAAVQQGEMPSYVGVPIMGPPLIEIFLHSVDLTPEHSAPPSPAEQLRAEMKKAGLPDDVQKVVVSYAVNFSIPPQLNSHRDSHLIVTKDEYEKMGKPTVGQHITLDIEITQVD